MLDLISALVQTNNFYRDGSDTSGEINVKNLMSLDKLISKSSGIVDYGVFVCVCS